MHWDDGWGWGVWLMMMGFMVVFWGLIAWVVVTLVREQSRTRHPPQSRSAQEILAERFARGEIDEDEYARRRDALR